MDGGVNGKCGDVTGKKATRENATPLSEPNRLPGTYNKELTTSLTEPTGQGHGGNVTEGLDPSRSESRSNVGRRRSVTVQMASLDEAQQSKEGLTDDLLDVLVLVLVLIKDHFIIKRMLATWHPYTRASFLCQ